MEVIPQFVDMARDDDDENMSPLGAGLNPPVYPPGLCLYLTTDEVEKLGLDDNCEVGDMLHGHFLASVTSISKREAQDGNDCRIELQITHLTAMEDEDEENREVDEENYDEE